ncbi:MAG: leucyl aminopeptidase family protein, partial [Notoacmeibacter sp.]|nr:leucyl aminopeptidase family protein [Notoacmeibacter sp.]
MPVTLIADKPAHARPVHCIRKGGFADAGLGADMVAWAEANSFDGAAGEVLLVPGSDGGVGAALLGLGDGTGGFAPLVTG